MKKSNMVVATLILCFGMAAQARAVELKDPKKHLPEATKLVTEIVSAAAALSLSAEDRKQLPPQERNALRRAEAHLERNATAAMSAIFRAEKLTQELHNLLNTNDAQTRVANTTLLSAATNTEMAIGKALLACDVCLPPYIDEIVPIAFPTITDSETTEKMIATKEKVEEDHAITIAGLETKRQVIADLEAVALEPDGSPLKVAAIEAVKALYEEAPSELCETSAGLCIWDACTSDDQCSCGYCESGYCEYCLASGDECSFNYQCCTGLCENSMCFEPGPPQ